MAASRVWMEGALAVIGRRLSENEALELVTELRRLPGANASVRATLDALHEALAARARARAVRDQLEGRR